MIKPYLDACVLKLVESLTDTENPIKTIAKERKLIPDCVVLQRALKRYMKIRGKTNNAARDTKRYAEQYEWVQNNPDKAKSEGLEELPIIPLHGLRHSCATLLNYLEINIIEISKTLGHSTCSTTMNIYAHSFEEQQEEVATKVNEFLRLNA